VYLQHQGNSRLAHTHIFSFDEEEKNQFLFDVLEEKSGLKNACNIISNNFTNELRQHIGRDALDISTLEKLDLILLKLFRNGIAGN
jgi:hypothetical protein